MTNKFYITIKQEYPDNNDETYNKSEKWLHKLLGSASLL